MSSSAQANNSVTDKDTGSVDENFVFSKRKADPFFLDDSFDEGSAT